VLLCGFPELLQKARLFLAQADFLYPLAGVELHEDVTPALQPRDLVGSPGDTGSPFVSDNLLKLALDVLL
jgi:hypothetical protein